MGAGIDADDEDVIDVIFVDDACFILLAKSPKLLDQAIQVLIKLLVEVFGRFQLGINWDKNKTEAMIKYRGKKAKEAFESRRYEGKLSVAVPGTGRRLHLVQEYKHLGRWVAIANNLNKDAKHREQQGMAAYSPLSCGIFGLLAVNLWLKMIFLDALVLSRVLSNAHIVAPTPFYKKKLNMCHMRVLRKIANKSRWCDDKVSDLQVRQMPGSTSIGCILIR